MKYVDLGSATGSKEVSLLLLDSVPLSLLMTGTRDLAGGPNFFHGRLEHRPGRDCAVFQGSDSDDLRAGLGANVAR